jgi:hypothetical protein
MDGARVVHGDAHAGGEILDTSARAGDDRAAATG